MAVVAAYQPARADFDAAADIYRRSDYKGAMEAFLTLAELGDARAQTVLALMYKYGEGVPLDLERSFGWYKEAAELGYAPAQFHTGVSLAEGIGTPIDNDQAIHWLALSAEAGFERAQDKLQELNATGAADIPVASDLIVWSKNWDFNLPVDIRFQLDEQPASEDSFRVQFGAMSTEQAAHSLWNLITQCDLAMFSGFPLLISQSIESTRTLYRVQTGPFNTLEDAAEFCQKLRGKIETGCLSIRHIP